jgi:uncharacterized protein YdbL (DUF1318 family)
VHRYEFSRNQHKFYLIERNRLLLLLTAYQTRTIALIAPALLLLELAMLALAIRQGWLGAKLRGYGWLVRNHAWLRSRRALIQTERRRSDRDLAQCWTARIDPAVVSVPAGTALLNAVLAAYWALVRRLL